MSEQTISQTLKRFLENSPKAPGVVQDGLLGWWLPDGWFLCASCAGRIMARGLQIPAKSEPAWKDTPYGVCCCCETPEDSCSD